MQQKPIIVILGGLVLFQAGLLLGQLQPLNAYAETPEEALAPVAEFYDPPRLYCKPFQVPLEGARAAFETNDRTTAIGKWLAAEEESYELFSVDFEVGNKPTGYPMGIAFVCLSPR